MSNLPEIKVRKVTIGEVFKVSSGGTPSRKIDEYFTDGNIAWVKTGDLKGKFVTFATEFISQLGLDNSSAKVFPPKTVLLAMYGATIGACSILPFAAATNQACAAILPSDDCSEVFLYYYLLFIKPSLINKGVGGAQPNISAGLIKNLEIPLPPLTEQQKIASILDAADSLRQKDQQLIEKYTALSQSLFLEMFGDPVSNPMEWNFSMIADLTEGKTLNGFFAKKEHYVESGTPIVWITDFINKIYVETDDLRRVSIKQDDIYKYKLAYGDVLFCRSSLTVEGIGKCAIVPKSITQDVLFECHIIKVRLGAQVLPEYFRFLSNTSYFRSKVMKSAKTSTMTTISQDGITDILIPIPPIALQNQFAERIQSIEAQKQLALASLKKSEALFNSLLQRAFKGELTT
ncbi:MAG: restriction endonuclease subunit S [Methylococcaceae bacterium]